MSMNMFAVMEKALGSNQPISTTEEERCPNCNSLNFGQQDGDTICMDCGTNLGPDIDHGPEWRNDKNTGEDMSRCNLARNELLPESSMSTCIALGRNAPKVHYDLQRTMTWNGVPHHERSMRNKMDEISYVCHNNNIPESIIEYAQHQYFKIVKALEKNNMKRKRGKNDAGMRAAALYIAYKDDHKPRTYKEIAKLFGIESKYVSEGLSLFSDLVRPEGQATIYSDYIDEFCRSLNLGPEISDRVATIADKADALGILENNAPTSIVAGCIYYVTVEHALQLKVSDVAATCNVSTPTINKVCGKLFNRTIDLIDDEN